MTPVRVTFPPVPPAAPRRTVLPDIPLPPRPPPAPIAVMSRLVTQAGGWNWIVPAPVNSHVVSPLSGSAWQFWTVPWGSGGPGTGPPGQLISTVPFPQFP